MTGRMTVIAAGAASLSLLVLMGGGPGRAPESGIEVDMPLPRTFDLDLEIPVDTLGRVAQGNNERLADCANPGRADPRPLLLRMLACAPVT